MATNAEEQDPDSPNEQTQLTISKLVKLSKTANNKFPSKSDYSYFSSYPSFTEQSNKLSNDVLTLLSKLCNFVNPPNHNNTAIDLLNEDNEYLRWQTISDSADHCIEQTDICLDHIKERRQNQSIMTSTNSTNNSTTSIQSKPNRLFAGEINDNNSLETLYPQQRFLDHIDNSRDVPFTPKLTSKPNAIKELNLELVDDEYYENPYKFEIGNIEYAEYQLSHRAEEQYYNINDTPFYWINTVSALSEMCNTLSFCNEIGVDIEHHSKHSFQGMVCLIQISTRNRDYIIDALVLRKALNEYLNPIFTNPKIVKIFHGANMDILWLQRDFSIYVVNLFDTFQASKLLNLTKKSLKYLLKQYCDIDTNKKLQLSDWRIRPLTQDTILYARTDTHYLLYLFDHLTNLLIERSTINNNLLTECYNLSQNVCLQRYAKPYYSKDGWKVLCQKKGWYFINNKSLNVLSKLYEWRDAKARTLDQSIDVVLSNNVLKAICNKLPKNKQELNYKSLSIIAKKYCDEILNIVQEGVNMDDKDSINVMFEVSNTEEKKINVNENCSNLNEICNSNDGCFGDGISVMNADKIEKLDMMSMDDKQTNSLFFPIDNEYKIDDDTKNAQEIANNIYNDLSNEPVLQIIKQTIKSNENNNADKKKKLRSRRKADGDGNVNNNKNNKKRIKKQKQKLKNNNIDPVANAVDRGKIFGSRYLDRNSKKDVFKLPRNKNKNNKKRKGNDENGPILETVQPSKKRKLSKYQRIQEKLKVNRQKKRAQQTTAVDNEWPFKNEQEKSKKKSNKNRDQNKNKMNDNTRNVTNNKEENDLPMTESDLLDAAPVPVFDTKFDEVYNPFQQNNNLN